MRYDTKVGFVVETTAAEYNPETGKYESGEETVQERYCHVYDLGAERTVKLFGRVDLRALVVHHLGYLIDADRVRIGGVEYHVKTARQVRGKSSYIVAEATT